MNKLKKYVGVTLFFAIAAVLFVIVSLDTIFQIVNQIGKQKGDYGVYEAAIYSFLYIPSSLYEYIPLSALVGSLVGLGALASRSELVVIRAAGVSMVNVIWFVFRPVLLVIFIGFLIGEFIAPYTGQYADSRRALAQGHKQSLESERGVWNREGNEFMHFNAVLPNGKLFGITRFLLDEEQRLLEVSFVDSAIYQGEYWFEQDGVVTSFGDKKLTKNQFSTRRWYTEVSPDLLNVLVLNPEDLPLTRLHSYARYLDKQKLDSIDYRLVFWQKIFQPLATLSLVVFAISFILGPLRQVTMGFRIFVGVLVGLAFQTVQKLLGPASIVWGFSPFVAVLVPVLISLILGIIILRRAE